MVAVPKTRAFWMGLAAYVVPSFAVAYLWHLAIVGPSMAWAYRD